MRIHLNKTIQTIGLSVFSFVFFAGIQGCSTDKGANVNRIATVQEFLHFDFDTLEFKKGDRKYGPFTRWWWPGNDVESEELKREVKLFAANGFAGIEIQPFTYGLNHRGTEEQLRRQFSWNSSLYVEHLKAVMEQARKSSIVVDITAGSGWPLGGPDITFESAMQTLAYADTIITGGNTLLLPVPRIKPDSALTGERAPGSMFYKYVDTSYAKLQAVVAGKYLRQKGEQIQLDENTLIDVTGMVSGGVLNWAAPPGQWMIIGFWSLPDGEVVRGMAARPYGLVVDHLNADKMNPFYERLFGDSSGLQQYYGNPLRAVFNDSYEFLPDRHFSDSFISFFKQRRGYDIVPYLLVNMQKGYNSAYGPVLFPGQQPRFILSENDWRLRYDYDLTISELIQSQFISNSTTWLNHRGLLHRTQAYGAKMDVISNCGAADIPETEQLAGNNSEGFIKLVTSGAHLNNRPVIAQESFVFMNLAETMTPQKLKILADKSFAAGVNQIIYHGSPYKYNTGEFGKEGWTPFSSPFLGINFSSRVNESSPFWNDINTVNQYISRLQYALRSGKPKADVLIYFPFIDFYPEQVVNNPEEILHAGYFKGVEPDFGLSSVNLHDDLTVEWFKKLWPVVNQLEAAGISWEFVNDKYLLDASSQDAILKIKGNAYNALIIPEAPFMALKTAEKINILSKEDFQVVFIGKLPSKQPSFANWKTNDSLTSTFVNNTLLQHRVEYAVKSDDLKRWIASFKQKIQFVQPYSFLRQINREMTDGSMLKYIWNKTDERQTISFKLDSSYQSKYWINPETNEIQQQDSYIVSYTLQPYGSVLLLSSPFKPAIGFSSSYTSLDAESTSIHTINKWDISASGISVRNVDLFDWRSKPEFENISGEGIYHSSFSLKQETGKKYFIDLGKVYFTADVYINGKAAGKKIWAPYLIDITSLVHDGKNEVRIKVMTTNRNEFIGQAIKQNPKYNHFKGKEKTLMPAGLAGPVKILSGHGF